jgi:hypothetical protein
MMDDRQVQGLRIVCASRDDLRALETKLERRGLRDAVTIRPVSAATGAAVDVTLKPELAQQWLPGFDTTHLVWTLALDTGDIVALEKEILIAWLASPIRIDFPSVAELHAGLHIRRNIVASGRRTSLSFDTAAAERPCDCWDYDEERGFTVRPGCDLIDALRRATQPERTGRMYSFSCYRATEYVILLGIAEELAHCNLALLAQLQHQCEQHVIRSGRFHEVFLHEYGTQEAPFPPRYYVPGDRVWFRNPDAVSSDVMGYEGSWVVYLGGGLFTNFWKIDQPYTLEDKCLEIYHWRHGVRRNEAGELVMDESIVEQRVVESRRPDGDAERIIADMMRLREPKGCYGNGGCIDTTREGPRWVCPGTSDIGLPL